MALKAIQPCRVVSPCRAWVFAILSRLGGRHIRPGSLSARGPRLAAGAGSLSPASACAASTHTARGRLRHPLAGGRVKLRFDPNVLLGDAQPSGVSLQVGALVRRSVIVHLGRVASLLPAVMMKSLVPQALSEMPPDQGIFRPNSSRLPAEMPLLAPGCPVGPRSRPGPCNDTTRAPFVSPGRPQTFPQVAPRAALWHSCTRISRRSAPQPFNG